MEQQSPKDHYDALMLSALQQTDWNKTKAVRLFRAQFRPEPDWVRSYAYRIYERITQKVRAHEAFSAMLNETAGHLRALASVARRHGELTLDLQPFKTIAELQFKLAGVNSPLVVQNVQNQQNVLQTMPTDELKERIDELKRLTGTGGIGEAIPSTISTVPIKEDQSVIPISTARKTDTSYE